MTSTAVEAIKSGALDFLDKPLTRPSDRHPAERPQAAGTATGKPRTEARDGGEVRDRWRKPGTPVGPGIGQASGSYQCDGDAVGESGVGKKLVARTIHRNSSRAGQRFIQVNCAAIPEELIESELFGHEKGSFTGATEKQVGKFEQADRGTIFLDEVADMSAKTQAKVLRVLQEQEVERLGSARTIKVDVRVVAATNKNLEEMIQRGNSARTSISASM